MKQPINTKGKPSLASGHLLLMREISNFLIPLREPEYSCYRIDKQELNNHRLLYFIGSLCQCHYQARKSKRVNKKMILRALL